MNQIDGIMTASSKLGTTVEIKNPKRLTIMEVDNGFSVSRAKVTEYGESYSVAKTKEELNEIITEYFN